jgi:hypothetical protein
MSAWDALYNAMRTPRPSRIGPDHAEQLLAGGPGAPDHAGLARLLSAAAAPARPHELAGEQAMVAEFVRVYREPAPRVQPPRARGVRLPRFGRMAAVKVAAGVALLAAGGTAFAAETGNLPGPAQRRAHDLFSPLGVPAPVTSAGRDAVTDRPPSPAAPSAVRSPEPSHSAAVALCRAWVESRRGPHAPQMPAEERRALVTAAGGVAAVPTYCVRVLREDQAGRSSTPDQPAPSQPANGDGGNNGSGNGKGKHHDGDASPSPKARH